MPNIFISYRRADSIGITERIHDRLSNLYGDQHVFKDVGDIRPGRDFRAVLSQELKKADVLLVMIGPEWVDIKDEDGRRRLDDPHDFVRFEVETGLARPDMLVIPVLVHGGQLPKAGVLPPSLEDLRYRNAVVVRNDPDFRHDLQALIEVINTKKRSRKGLLLLAALLVLVVAAAVVFALTTGNPPAASPGETVTTAANQVETNSPSEVPEQVVTETVGVTEAVTATAAATEAPEPTSETPAGGYAVQLIYDEDSFYLLNPGGRSLRSENIIFEGVRADGSPAGKSFSGSRWAALYSFIDTDKCTALEIVEATRHLKPQSCQDYNALRTPTRSSSEVFWAGEGISAFRVLWMGSEVGQCQAGQGNCTVYLP